MDLDLIKEIILLALFLTILFCVFTPLKLAYSAQQSGIDIFHSTRYAAAVSILNCFAGGIFLGTCLLHLFPDVRDSIDNALKTAGIDQQFPLAEFTIAMGFFMLLTFEQIISDIRERNYSRASENLPILRGDVNNGATGNDSPQDVSVHAHYSSIRAFAMIAALTIHSVFEGIAIGVQRTMEDVIQITGALIIHKIVIAFSLGLTLSQTEMSSLKSYLCGLLFASATPIGIAVGLVVTEMESINGSLVVGSLQGMAAGTFLYVTFLEVLPNEFRSGTMHLPKLFSFILGFSVICLALFFFPDN